ncbi:hypothetical protein [Curtobacterium sp. MCPF17_047]|uniref:hypothetical protein n=1 Tax=Curtobacterium sp. MCPF17_047 TaxID=2175654 RepID=UPI0011B81D8E|nr:hypothetical protein [Curtobacterium sp. MCPF17_047]
MAKLKKNTLSGLQRRIAAGQAEPISAHERAQLEAIRRLYEQRFGPDTAAASTKKATRERT